MASGIIRAGVTPVTEGGTGLNVGAIRSPYNTGSSLLEFIQAHETGLHYPFIIEKNGSGSTWTDLPENYQKFEGIGLVVGSYIRGYVIWTVFGQAKMFIRWYYWVTGEEHVTWRTNSDWVELH